MTTESDGSRFIDPPPPLTSPFPPPRWLSEPHPRRVGTYGPIALEWIRQRRLEDDLIPDEEKEPLPSWGLILDRALEHDADGVLCWRIVVLTVPRQSTKSTFMSELMAWRVHQSSLFGERQIAVHTANKLQAAVRIQEDLYPWAESCGYKVARRTGQERITLPDHSRWEITSLTAAFGSRPAFCFVDEGFDVPIELVEKAILPAQARRKSPQTWLVSTANSTCTALMPEYRAKAMNGSEKVCLIDWGLPDGADPTDRRWWEHTNPHPSPEYIEQVEEYMTSKDWRAQWLNVWAVRVTGKSNVEYAMPGWEKHRKAPPPHPRGGIVAIDEARDEARFGYLRLIGDCVYYSEHETLKEVVDKASLADHVIVGVSLVGAVAKEGLRHTPIKYGVRQLAENTPLLVSTVRSGRLLHDHSPVMLEQAAGAVLNETESGKTISARKSETDILGPKLLSWVLGYERTVSTMRPAIY